MLFGLAIVYGLYLKGWRLALLGGLCFFYLALFSLRGIYELSMETLSAIAVSAPLSALIGLLFGIVAAKRKRFHNALWPVLNVLQITTTLLLFNYCSNFFWSRIKSWSNSNNNFCISLQ